MANVWHLLALLFTRPLSTPPHKPPCEGELNYRKSFNICKTVENAFNWADWNAESEEQETSVCEPIKTIILKVYHLAYPGLDFSKKIERPSKMLTCIKIQQDGLMCLVDSILIKDRRTQGLVIPYLYGNCYHRKEFFTLSSFGLRAFKTIFWSES